MIKHLVPTFVGLATLALVAALRVLDPPIIEHARTAVYDSYQLLVPREYQQAPVRVVDIDEDSLAAIGQWPWSRVELARLVDRLGQFGAAAITLDVLFAEPDRTSPTRVIGEWSLSADAWAQAGDLRREIEALPDNDQVLADQLARYPVVTGFAFNRNQGGRGKAPARKAGIANAGADPATMVPSYTGFVNNLPILEANARGNGSFSLEPDADGVIRRIPLLQGYGGQVYPTLAVEALRVALGVSTIITRAADASGEVAFGEHLGLNAVKVGPLVLPTTADGHMWLHYTRWRPERVVSAREILSDSADPAGLTELLNGHIVLVGSSAAGLLDLRATPLNATEPGVLIQAQALEQMLTRHFLQRPDWADGAELLFIISLGIFLILLMPRIGALWCALIAVLAATAVVAASWYAFTELRMLIDPLYPVIATLLVYLSTSLISYLRSERERDRIRSAFTHYLAPSMVDRLAEHPEQLILGGETKELTIMFSDVRGFTAISELFKDNPEDLVKMVNDLLTPLSDEILKRRGTIDKYMGDCVMAFWNAPLDNPAHVEDACAAALAMYQRLHELNAADFARAELGGRAHMPLNIGIGINTGEVVVGNMGSLQRFDYSLLGDAANLASRLEGQSKVYGVDVVLGAATAVRAAQRFAVLELDLVAVKGKQEAVRIFTLVGDRELKESSSFAVWQGHHQDMLTAYRSMDWLRAEACLEQALNAAYAAGHAGLPHFYELYRGRIAEYLDNPPPADWDAVYRATTK